MTHTRAVTLIPDDDNPPIINNDQDFGEDPSPIPKVTFSFTQKVGQEIFKLEGAVVASIFFGEILPPVPSPHKYLLFTSGVFLNGIIGEGLSALVSKEDPLSGLRAEGANHAGKGFLKESSSNMIALGALAGAGYGIAKLVLKYGPGLTESTDQSEHVLGEILSEDAFMAPMVGILGYLVGKGIKQIGLALWSSLPEQEEVLKEQECHFTQIAGQYALRWLGNVMTTETVLFYLNIAGQTAGADWRTQIGIFIAVDAAKQLGKYFSFVPYPVDSLVRKSWGKTPEADQDYENPEVFHIPHAQNITHRDRFTVLSKRALIWCGVAMAGYALSEITCFSAELTTPDMCKEDTMAHRVARYSAFGIPLVAYVFEETRSKIQTKLLNCCSTLFSKKSPTPADEKPLLEDRKTLRI